MAFLLIQLRRVLPEGLHDTVEGAEGGGHVGQTLGHRAQRRHVLHELVEARSPGGKGGVDAELRQLLGADGQQMKER